MAFDKLFIYLLAPNLNDFFTMIDSKQLVVKSNQLIEARYEFSIWETRVFAKMVTMINKNDKKFQSYKIEINDLMKFFHTKSNNDYDRIREVPESLMKKIIRIPYVTESGEERLFLTPLITNATTPVNQGSDDASDKNSYVELTFHPDLKPYLLELKGRFLKYDISNVLRISSPYSVRIYELLKQYEGIGHRTISIQELKEILGIQNKYNRYTHFKTGIILKAQKNLKKNTDIVFEFEEIKEGKSVQSLKFLIFKNDRSQADFENSIVPKETVAVSLSPTVQELVALGIQFSKASALLEKLGEKQLSEELAYAKSELSSSPFIKNPPGFLIKMIEEQSYAQIKQVQKIQKRKRKKTEKQTQVDLQQIEELRLEYVAQRNQAVKEFFKGKSKTETNNLVDQWASPFTRKAIKKSIEQKNKEEEYDLKYTVIAKHLPEAELHDFEAFLELKMGLLLVNNEQGSSLKAI